MRRTTDESALEWLTAHFNDFDTVHFATDFWLHVWRITAGDHTFVYVGASPSPIPQTTSLPFEVTRGSLELLPNARGTAFGRQLRAKGIGETTYTADRAVAIGPIVPRNPRIASVAPALASHLCSRGYTVIGENCTPHLFDRGLFGRVCDLLENEFPARPVSR